MCSGLVPFQRYSRAFFLKKTSWVEHEMIRNKRLRYAVDAVLLAEGWRELKDQVVPVEKLANTPSIYQAS